MVTSLIFAVRYCLIPGVAFQVLLIIAIGCTQESLEAKKSRHRERAVQYFDKGEYREALIELRNLLKLDPKDADAHYRQGLAYLKLGTTTDLQQAFNEFSASVELNAENYDAQMELGKLYLLGKDPVNARKRADIVLAAVHDRKEGLILRGLALIGESKVSDGIIDLKKAVEINPTDVKTYIELARAHLHMKEFEAAESALQRALQAKPNSLDARFALADLHLINRRFDRAEAEYKRALSDVPDRPEPRLKLAGLYLSIGRPNDAESTYLAWAQSVPQDDRPLIALGDLYRETNQIDKAFSSFDKALAVNPKSTTARDRQITLLFHTNRLEEAQQKIEAIMRTNAKDPSGRFFEDRLMLARNQVEQAIAIFQPLSVEEPNSATMHHFFGIALARKGELPAAVQELVKAAKLVPNSLETHTALAGVYLKQRAADLAIEQAQAALRLDPRNSQAATILGESYLQKGDVKRGKQVFAALAQAVPGQVFAMYRLGLIAGAEKKETEALGYFEEALKSNPNFIEALAQITAIKVGQGKLEEAQHRLTKARDLSPRNPLIYTLLGRFYVSTNRSDLAEQAFKQAIELNDSVLDAYIGLASFYINSKRMDEAIHEYKNALSRNPNLVPAHMVLGMIYQSRGNLDEAQASYQNALKVNPRFAPAANNLAVLLIDRGGNSDAALSYAQTAREIMPNDANIADTLGWIYYQRKIYLLAAALLKEAVDKMVEDPTVQYHYGMVLYKNGNTTEAVKALEKSLKLNPNHPGAAEAKATLSVLKSTS